MFPPQINVCKPYYVVSIGDIDRYTQQKYKKRYRHLHVYIVSWLKLGTIYHELKIHGQYVKRKENMSILA